MKKQRFLYSSVILILSAVIVKIIGAFFRIPLANLLGGTGMGYFSCAYGIFMIIYAVSVTGLPAAVAKTTAERLALKQYRDVKRIKSISLYLFCITGLISSALILIAAYPFCTYIAGNEKAVPAVIAIAPSVLFGCIMSVYRGYYEGLQNMYPTAVSQVIEGLVKLAAGLGLCFYVINLSQTAPLSLYRIMKATGYKYTEDVLPFAAAAAIAGITLSTAVGTVYLMLRHKIKGDGISKKELSESALTYSDRQTVKSLMKILIPVAVGSLITNLTSLIDLTTIMRSLKVAVHKSPLYFTELTGNSVPVEIIPTFIFGSFTGLAVSVFNLVPSFTNMFGKGILPTLSAAFAENNTDNIKNATYNVIYSTAIVAVPAGLGISALSAPILSMLFPDKQAEIKVCITSLFILGIGVMFLSVSMSAFSIMQSAGKAELPVFIMLAGVIVKLLMNTFLVSVPEINVAGAAIATDFCYFIIFIISVYKICRITKLSQLKIYKMLFKVLFCAALCSITAFLTYSIAGRYVGNNISLVLSMSAGGLIYLLSAFLSGTINKNAFRMLIS